MKKLLIFSFLYLIAQFTIVGLLLIQLLLYGAGVVFLIEKDIIIIQSKFTGYAMLIISYALALAVTLLALVPIVSTFQKAVRKLEIPKNPINISHKKKALLCFLSTVVMMLILSFLIFYWYGYIDGTRTDPSINPAKQDAMRIFIALISLLIMATILGTAAGISELRKSRTKNEQVTIN